ncbi:MAG: hypothetical protein EBU90_04375 [Proteobacteria bacterium]|nr:hypothetical protein [Pseudomonadota bacterium]NBP15221.1 hypothetical protein [bacterium]
MFFSLQYVSDIHLEFHKEPFELKAVSKNLALCGDIGYLGTAKYNAFIKTCAQKFENVFVIFGNHEFYNEKGGDTWSHQTIEQLKASVQTANFPPNVYFLDNRSIFIDTRNNRVYQECPQDSQHDVLQIIGSTLWTDVEQKLGTVMNDYKYIYTAKNTLLTPNDVRNLYKQNVQYILDRLDKHPRITTVLLTHHGPHPVCNGRYTDNLLHSAYTSIIPELYKRANLLACISGHTHSSINESIFFENNHITFLSNQHGYPGENPEILRYNPDAKLDIPLLC